MTKKEKKGFYYIVCIESNYGTTNHKSNQMINYVFSQHFGNVKLWKLWMLLVSLVPGLEAKFEYYLE